MVMVAMLTNPLQSSLVGCLLVTRCPGCTLVSPGATVGQPHTTNVIKAAFDVRDDVPTCVPHFLRISCPTAERHRDGRRE